MICVKCNQDKPDGLFVSAKQSVCNDCRVYTVREGWTGKDYAAHEERILAHQSRVQRDIDIIRSYGIREDYGDDCAVVVTCEHIDPLLEKGVFSDILIDRVLGRTLNGKKFRTYQQAYRKRNREKINAKKRENYRKRKLQMTEEELQRQRDRNRENNIRYRANQAEKEVA